MDLAFNQTGNKYIAEFMVTGDFNLHIEGVNEGDVRVFQRGSDSGGYALVREATPRPPFGNVYDMDFSGSVYPKYIRVSCLGNPTSATLTFNE